MSEPIGFLITWTCYGTWVYSDDRGSVDDEHNVYGTPFLPTDRRRIAGLRRRMAEAPFRLSEPARAIVTETIEEHCRRRGWELLAVNARSNHVHVVVRFAGVTPEVMMGQWKAWSSRRLREHSLAASGRPIWTRRATGALVIFGRRTRSNPPFGTSSRGRMNPGSFHDAWESSRTTSA